MMRYTYYILALLSLAVSASGAGTQQPATAPLTDCPTVKMDVERLPDLNIPRMAHATLCLDGELTVMGGHTSGFVPTATIEYFRDGAWHVVPTVYPHDAGVAVALSTGKVLLAGGYQQPLGIGQTHTVEFYDPVTHTTVGEGCLDTRRAMASGVELDSGSVLIAGNWYHQDDIELYDGQGHFRHVKPSGEERANPFLLRCLDGDVLICGGDSRGKAVKSGIVDRLKGEPFCVPLLQQWRPMSVESVNNNMTCCAIGDPARHEYDYLMAVMNDSLQFAVAHVTGTDFTLLPLASEIPRTFRGDTIGYCSVVADRKAKRAYLFGREADEARLFVAAIDYDRRPAPVTLYYTDSLQSVGHEGTNVVLMPDGNLALIGGSISGNYHPLPSALILHVAPAGHAADASATTGSTRHPLLFVLSALLLAALVAAYCLLHRKRRHTPAPGDDTADNSPACARWFSQRGPAAPVQDDTKQLMDRLREFMEHDQPYLNSELKIGEVAASLGTNTRYISDSIKFCEGTSFAQFVNAYRIEHAKRLLRHNPNKKIAEVYVSSGFANETSFFRTFKSFTGMTPREWIQNETHSTPEP